MVAFQCNARHKDIKNKRILPKNHQKNEIYQILLLVVNILQIIHTVTQASLFFVSSVVFMKIKKTDVTKIRGGGGVSVQRPPQGP